MAWIRGINVTLYAPVEVGRDRLDAPVYEDQPCEVGNVLVCPLAGEDASTAQHLYGSRAVYELCIPKGDTHQWTAGSRVDFYGESFRIIGTPVRYMEHLVPLCWNMKVRVERYG